MAPEKAAQAADEETVLTRLTKHGLRIAEDGLYALVSLVLVAGAAIVLADSVHSLATETAHDVGAAIEHTLDSLLIVFILVELLSAVRTTIEERRLVAEPFLLVGIIASIKEIVVIGAFAERGSDKVSESMLQVGVLGAVVVGLSVATLLVRRKEREPSE